MADCWREYTLQFIHLTSYVLLHLTHLSAKLGDDFTTLQFIRQRTLGFLKQLFVFGQV